MKSRTLSVSMKNRYYVSAYGEIHYKTPHGIYPFIGVGKYGLIHGDYEKLKYTLLRISYYKY